MFRAWETGGYYDFLPWLTYKGDHHVQVQKLVTDLFLVS